MHSRSFSPRYTMPFLYVQSLLSVYSGVRRSYSWYAFAVMAGVCVTPLPSLRDETCPGSCVLISATPFRSPSSANSTASSHRFHPKPRWRNIDRLSWRKGEGCCNIGCPRSCFIQILEDARLCETGCSIEFRIIGIESLELNTVASSDYFCVCVCVSACVVVYGSFPPGLLHL